MQILIIINNECQIINKALYGFLGVGVNGMQVFRERAAVLV